MRWLAGLLGTLALLIVVSGLASAQTHTPLGSLAASLAPGAWAELHTNNINPTLANTGGSSNFIFGYAQSVRWDPITRQLFYLGGDHVSGFTARFVSYAEATNTWAILPQHPWMLYHGQDHIGLDPVGRHVFWRQNHERHVYRYHLDTQQWSGPYTNNVLTYPSCCAGLDYFPELGGLVWVQAGESSDKAGVFLLSDATQEWSRLGAYNTYAMGSYQNFAEYNPVHKVLWFGGGNGSGATRVYKLTAAGTVTALKNAPVGLGTQQSINTVDPVTGEYLILTSARTLHGYDVTTDTWRTLPAPPSAIFTAFSPPIHGIVAAPIASHGVVVFVTCKDGSGTSCQTWLYKHAAGSQTAPQPSSPADTVPPTVSISTPAASETLSGNVTVTANATDYVGVKSVQIRLNGQALGSPLAAPPYNFSWDTTKTPNGTHTLSAEARDAAGNTAVSPAVSVTVLNTTAAAPSPSSPSPSSATPDLVIESVRLLVNNTLVTQRSPGDSVTVEYRARNAGSQSIRRGYSQEIRLSTSPTGGNVLLALHRRTDALAPGQTRTFSLSITIPRRTKIGPYFVVVTGDAANRISGDHRANNTASAPLTVGSSKAPSSSGITVNPAAVDFTTPVGMVPSPQTLTVTVAGGAAWSTFDQSPFYDTTEQCRSRTCPSGASTTITPKASAIAALPAGTYSAPLTVRSPGVPDLLVPVTLTISPSPTSSSPQSPKPLPAAPSGTSDFATRCAQPGVVRCFSFDSESETAPYLEVGASTPVVDPTVKASGAGSLRMTVPPNSAANTSGTFSMNFSPGSRNYSYTDAYPVQFGEGEEFYVQWRQRFSPEFLAGAYAGGGGWKQAIIGRGDTPGVPAYSCTQLQIVTQNTYHRGYPQMYHSCGGKDGKYEGFEEPIGTSDFLMQSGADVQPCLYSGNTSGCFRYKADQWLTFQVRVKVGTWYKNDGNYRRDSVVQLWVAEEGQASVLVIDKQSYDIANNSSVAKYGKVWLLPYNTGKSASVTYPEAYIWYDDLIVSRTKIADPD